MAVVGRLTPSTASARIPVQRPREAPFASAWRRAHLTVEERLARGRIARQVAPRASHGRWQPENDRRDPIELLEEQATTRIAELVPIRYGRMSDSPFAF